MYNITCNVALPNKHFLQVLNVCHEYLNMLIFLLFSVSLPMIILSIDFVLYSLITLNKLWMGRQRGLLITWILQIRIGSWICYKAFHLLLTAKPAPYDRGIPQRGQITTQFYRISFISTCRIWVWNVWCRRRNSFTNIKQTNALLLCISTSLNRNTF